jgi:hypothetical protein
MQPDLHGTAASVAKKNCKVDLVSPTYGKFDQLSGKFTAQPPMSLSNLGRLCNFFCKAYTNSGSKNCKVDLVLLNGCTFAKKIAEPAIPGFRGRPGDVEARQPAEVEGGMCKLSLFAQDMF